MSQMTATVRVAPRAHHRRAAEAQPLRVVDGAAGHPGNALFAVLCVLLLAGGLIGLLVLNTTMAEGSFTLHRLQATSGELTDSEQALTAAIDAQEAPANLAARAAHLGMVPADSAAFLRLSDGKVLGVAKPAKKAPGFTVVTAPEASTKATAQKSGPRTTVKTTGDVTTTTVVTTKPDGSIVTTVTSVNARTKTTSSTTTTKPAPASTATPPTPAPAGAPTPAR